MTDKHYWRSQEDMDKDFNATVTFGSQGLDGPLSQPGYTTIGDPFIKTHPTGYNLDDAYQIRYIWLPSSSLLKGTFFRTQQVQLRSTLPAGVCAVHSSV